MFNVGSEELFKHSDLMRSRVNAKRPLEWFLQVLEEGGRTTADANDDRKEDPQLFNGSGGSSMWHAKSGGTIGELLGNLDDSIHILQPPTVPKHIQMIHVARSFRNVYFVNLT